MGAAFVLGAAGFLGSHVVDALCAGGWSVTAGCRSAAPWRLRDARCDIVTADVLDPRSIQTALGAVKPDLIVNCAAYGVHSRERDWTQATAVNALGALHVAQAVASAATRLIHVGTCFEYGPSTDHISESHPLAPSDGYAASKAAGALLVQAFGGQAGASFAVVRPSSMYGPREDKEKLVPSILQSALDQQALDLSSGHAIRDYIYVADAAEGIARVAGLRAWPPGLCVNLGSGHGQSVKDFGSRVALLAGGANLRWGRRPDRVGEPGKVVCDSRLATRLLGWKAATSLEEGVKSSIQELRARGPS